MTSASAPAIERGGSYVDWPAVIAGAVSAAAIGVVFSSFGAALGLSAVSAREGEGSGGFALILVGAWMLVSALLAYAAGGYIAGRMRRRVDTATADEVSARDGIHGLVVWALGVVLSAWLMAGAVGSAFSAAGSAVEATGSAIGGVASATGDAVSTAGSAVGDVAQSVADDEPVLPGVSANPLEIVNNRLLRGTGVELDQTADLSAEAMTILGDVAVRGEMTEGDASYLAGQLAQNSNLTQPQARERVDAAAQSVIEAREAAIARKDELIAQAQAQAEEAEQAARDAAEAARRSSVLGGFALTAAMLIAAAGSMWAATIGGRHRDEGRIFAGFRWV